MGTIKGHFTETAALIGDPVRATVLWTLLDGRAFTATELAFAAETSASNMSMHLSKLLKAGILAVKHQGRHRYYALAEKEIAYAIETLAAMMPVSTIHQPATSAEPAVQECRTCYDHLAGKTGVAITDALCLQRLIILNETEATLTAKGRKWFTAMNIPVAALQLQRRSFLRPCLDWSERRYHIAGSLAASFLRVMLEEDWLRKTRQSRAIIITAHGKKMLYKNLNISM